MTYANPQTAGQTPGANNPGINPAGAINQTPSASFVAGGVGGADANKNRRAANQRQFRQCHSVFIVNCARGRCADTNASAQREKPGAHSQVCLCEALAAVIRGMLAARRVSE